MSKGYDRIIVQSSNDSSKAAEQLLNKTEKIHISQEEISLWIQVIDWSLIKLQPLGIRKNNIHIVTCNDGYIVKVIEHSGSESDWILLKHRWKHKIDNWCMYSFHCYPFDFIFSGM